MELFYNKSCSHALTGNFLVLKHTNVVTKCQFFCSTWLLITYYIWFTYISLTSCQYRNWYWVDGIMCSNAHPLHRHYQRRPLVILRVDPVDLSSMGQCLCHVRQAASTRGPVQLQTWAVLFGLIENHLLTGWRRRQCGRHSHGRRLSSLWKNGRKKMCTVTTY